MTYAKIKSNFVKSELKKTKWAKRHYIDDLLRIERYLSGKGFGWMTGYIINNLKDKYPKQWKTIFLELDPKQYEKNLENKKKEAEQTKKDDEKRRIKANLEYDKSLDSWKKMGGK